MQKTVRQRTLMEADYYIINESTVRATAKACKTSKSTVYKDLTEFLPKIDMKLYLKVIAILRKNSSQAHLRGGIATKQKYLNLKQ